MYTIDENGNVYYSDEQITRQVGVSSKAETIRIDNETVEDVAYTFDLELGEYVEQSRTQRAEPLPQTPESDADKLIRLESENETMKAQQIQISTDLQGFMDFYFSL